MTIDLIFGVLLYIHHCCLKKKKLQKESNFGTFYYGAGLGSRREYICEGFIARSVVRYE